MTVKKPTKAWVIAIPQNYLLMDPYLSLSLVRINCPKRVSIIYIGMAMKKREMK